MAYFPEETISETEFVLCPEPDLATDANINCDDFEETWFPPTVETTITRGKKLRECKPTVQVHHEYQVGIDYVKPCPEKKRSHRKCYQRTCCDFHNSPCMPTHSPPCGCCPNSSSVRSKTYKKSQTSLSHKQCSLRIMELATPTKRHCLDTWRSKSHILPDYMLDRIRQHVMDERPIVQIPDALNYFKKCVSSRSSRSSKCKVSDACMSDMRRYSAIFAHCVARKLDKPLNITLNPELEKVSRIVSYEISRVTGKNSKKGHRKNKQNKFERQMQDEMSKKVTAWIDNVLEDTSGKLLEDQFRDLEEEEGPVWDVIDDLIDDVLNSCEPEEEDAKYETAGDITEEDSVLDHTSDDIETTYTVDGDGDGEGNDNDLSIEDFLAQQINKELDKIISKQEDDLGTGYLDSTPDNTQTGATENVNDVTKADILNENILNDNVDNVVDNTDAVTDDKDTGLENVNMTIPSNKPSEYVFEHVTEEETQDQQEIDENVERNDEPNENNSENDDETGETTKVSALYTNSEESLDDINKTVKFSKVDDDLGGIADIILQNQKLPELENKEKDGPKKFNHENSIVFSSPNESLLSDADEPWPSDISVGGPKLSANVSKSIMSLGLIQENVDEEIQAVDEISVEVTNGGGTVIDLIQNKVNDVQEETLNNGENINAEEIKIAEAHKPQKLTTDQINYIKTAVVQQSKLTDNTKKDNIIDELGTSTISAEEMKHLRKEIIQSVHTFDGISDKENEDLSKLGSSTLIKEDVKYFKKEAMQSFVSDNVVLPSKKVNYKVDAKTAPSWVVSGHCDKGKGEPEDSFPKHKDEKEINEGDVRILAKNLEIISANLLIWNDWIDTTCKNIKHIKRKSERYKSCKTNTYRKKDIHYWIKLEKCVNKDAQFWLKFKHSAKKKLKTFDIDIQADTTHQRTKQHDAKILSIKCNCKMDYKRMPDTRVITRCK